MQMYLVSNGDPATAEVVNVLQTWVNVDTNGDPTGQSGAVVERYDSIDEEWHKEIVSLKNLMTKEQVQAL